MEEKPNDQISEEEMAKIFSSLASAVQVVYLKPKKLYLRSFFSGMFSALGATIGVAIIITFLSILVKEFGGLPVIGHWLTVAADILKKKGN